MLGWCLTAILVTGLSGANPSDEVSFNRQIRPLLSDRCFPCHGPDAAARQAGLRLDDRHSAIDSGVIVPGDRNASVLLERINAEDAGDRMPPTESRLRLTADERALLEQWIEQGAAYEAHWAFVAPPVHIEPPQVDNRDWVRDELDRFVLHRLETEKLTPSPPASRTRWLRRVTYDLTGLPPTRAEIDAFLADDSPIAFEHVVDRLLASPHFGERMAVPWLDAARYADSYGFQSDLLSPTWPWRDWVVRAFNDNMPYDEFITRQLAGDLRPQASRDDRLATAFNRLHRMTNEGGSIPEESRIEFAADRVETMGTALLGLTLGCTRCHDHKYDPITQREYYQLTAYFNSIDEHGLYETTGIVPTPSLLLPTSEQEQQLATLAAEVQRCEAALQAALQEPPDPDGSTASALPAIGVFTLDAVAEDGAIANDVEGGAGDGTSGIGASTEAPMVVPGRRGHALRLDGDNMIRLPGLADVDRWTPFTVAFWVLDHEPDNGWRVIAHRSSGTDAGHYGFDLMAVDGRLVSRAFRHWPGNAIAVQTRDTVLAPGTWTHIVWSYDGSSRADGLRLFVDGMPCAVTAVRDRLWKTIGGGTPYGPSGHDLTFGQRFRDRGLRNGDIDDIVVLRRAASDEDARHLFEHGTAASRVESNRVRDARVALQNARRNLAQYEVGVNEIMVMEELPQPRDTHVLARGAYDAARSDATRVQRDVPRMLGQLGEPPSDRAELAAWLTHPDHPLTARVAINRLWQQCFGRGLVETSENFGLQGALPTHPQLLDTLARDFIRSGWDTRAMLRRLVLSATYRQDSVTTTELRARDPDNRLLARSATWRLDAEMIRDTALAASGLLARDLGGPPVRPYQPAGLWREVNSFSPAYQQSSGAALYRRSLYTAWKRTAPHPGMTMFDAPGREYCVVRRTSTNTPLQALVLLNDPQYVEACRVLATAVLTQHSTDRARLDDAFFRLTGRPPTSPERDVLILLLDEQRDLYQERPDDAAALCAVGETPLDPQATMFEVAAWTTVIQAIMNTDATVWRR